jgi:hypothetical protein
MADDEDNIDDINAAAEYAELLAAVQAIMDRDPTADPVEGFAIFERWLEQQPEAEREKLTRAMLRSVYEDIVDEIKGDE